MIDLDIPGLGAGIARIDGMPSFGINHNLVYERQGEILAHSITERIRALRQATNLTISFREPIKVNRVEYVVVANVQRIGGEWRVWFSGSQAGHPFGAMTEKARKKLNNDEKLTEAIAAWCDENIDLLRAKAIDTFRNEVAGKLAIIRSNLNTIEKALNSAVNDALDETRGRAIERRRTA